MDEVLYENVEQGKTITWHIIKIRDDKIMIPDNLLKRLAYLFTAADKTTLEDD